MTEYDARKPAMWGQRITITDWRPKEEICRGNGHWSPRPKVGDTFLYPSRRGHLVLEFTNVEYTRDPDDMFFFDAVPIDSVPKE